MGTDRKVAVTIAFMVSSLFFSCATAAASMGKPGSDVAVFAAMGVVAVVLAVGGLFHD